MKKLEKGFTLNELMIVVAIIGILAAVAAPRFGTQIQRARDSKAIALISTWRSASSLYYSEELKLAENFGQLSAHVDDSTVRQTFQEEALTSTVTGTAVNIWVAAGTSAHDSNNVSATYNATQGSINFDSDNGNTTRTDVAWDSL